MDEFDEKLSQAIDETIRYCLGAVNAQIIYRYLEKQGCPEQKIPENSISSHSIRVFSG
jgi:hypothetical protein